MVERGARQWLGGGVLLGLWMVLGLACSDGGTDDPTPTPTPDCTVDGDCGADQVCEEGACVPDTPDPNPGPNPDPLPMDAGEDAVPDTPDPEPDAGPEPEDVLEDVPDIEDEPVEDVPDPEPDAEPDTPLEPRPDELVGGISLFEANIKANFFIQIRRGNAGAAFVEPTDPTPPVETIGACDLVEFSAEEAPPPFGYDIGDIELTSERIDATLSPEVQDDGSVVYVSSFAADNDQLFSPGTEVNVRAVGGRHIRGFRTSVVTPEAHTVTTPEADSAIVGSEALDIAWTGADSGTDVVISVAPFNNAYAAQNGLGLNCVVEGDPGNFTIPAEAMSRLGAPRLAIVVIKLTNAEVAAGEDTFVVNATYAGGNFVQRQN